MEVVMKYRCSKCGMLYDTEKRAMECENHHGSPEKVRKAEKCPNYEENGVPVMVEVKMNNGRVAQYRYCGELDSSVWEEETCKE